MVLNICVRTGRATTGALGTAVAAVLLSACGAGPDYRYIESSDGHMFAKIPHEWQVDREGAVSFSMIDPNQAQLAFTPDDDVQPWRADFRAPGTSGDVPTGFVEVQHIDARWRETFRLNRTLDDASAEFDDYERTSVSRNGYIGYHITYTSGDDDDRQRFNEVYLMDQRRSALYRLSLGCDTDCADRYEGAIGEVIDTFTVKP